MAYLCLVKGIEPKNIFAMTFTNKAAQEMKTRLIHLIKQYDLQKRIKYKELNHVGTFHSICASILRSEMHHLTPYTGLNQKFIIFDSDEQETIIKNLYRTSRNDVIRNLLSINLSNEDMEKILNPSLVIQTISRCKNQEITSREFVHSNHKDMKQIAISHLYVEYQEYLKNNNGVDFDDLLLHVVFLFEHFAQVREKYATQCVSLLVDEFQDINKLQYKVALYLNSKRKSIFLVGDSDQNIYTFRFSDSSIMNDIIRNYNKEGKHMKIIVMNQNYRSTENIVKFSDKIISENTNRLRTDKLITSNTQGIPVSILTTSNEADFIANEIIKLTQLDSNIQYSDFAILIRVNSASRLFEEKFDERKIPYKMLNSTRFYDSMEVKDILSYAKAISDPDNDHFLLSCVNIPRKCLSENSKRVLLDIVTQLKKPIRKIMKDHENEIRTYLSSEELKMFKSTIAFIEKSSMNVHSPSSIVKDIIQVTDYISYLKSTQKNMFETRSENLNELINLCQEFESKSTDPTLGLFLQSISVSTDADPSLNDSNNSITISTIHAAKGLEFGIVFVTGVEEGTIPYYKAKEKKELEEERRLLFVACTRAQSLLCLTSSKKRFKFGSYIAVKRSNFLSSVMSSHSSYYSSCGLSAMMSNKNLIQERQETIKHLVSCRDKRLQQATSSTDSKETSSL